MTGMVFDWGNGLNTMPRISFAESMLKEARKIDTFLKTLGAMFRHKAAQIFAVQETSAVQWPTSLLCFYLIWYTASYWFMLCVPCECAKQELLNYYELPTIYFYFFFSTVCFSWDFILFACFRELFIDACSASSWSSEPFAPCCVASRGPPICGKEAFQCIPHISK